MKIVLTGGGTGGHFFPLIAVAEDIRSIMEEQKLLPIKLYYFSDAPYDKRALFENGIQYVHIPAGKSRLPAMGACRSGFLGGGVPEIRAPHPS